MSLIQHLTNTPSQSAAAMLDEWRNLTAEEIMDLLKACFYTYTKKHGSSQFDLRTYEAGDYINEAWVEVNIRLHDTEALEANLKNRKVATINLATIVCEAFRNLASKTVKRMDSRTAHELYSIDDESQEQFDPSVAPDNVEHDAIVNAEISEILRELSPDDQLIFIKRYNDYSYREIAEMRNCSDKAVRKRVDKMKPKLLSRGFSPSRKNFLT